MSLIKKADVEHYFSARRKKIVFPFGPVSQPDATGYSGNGRRDTNPNVTSSGTLAVKKPQAWTPIRGGLFEPLQLAPRYLLANAERDGEKYAVSLGATSLQQMRRLPANQLSGNAGGIVHPVIEPYLLPVSPYEAFASGQQNDVPLLIGSNAEEARAWVDVTHVTAATFDSDLEHSYGALPPPLVAAYPHATDEDARQARLGLERDLRFGDHLETASARSIAAP